MGKTLSGKTKGVFQWGDWKHISDVNYWPVKAIQTDCEDRTDMGRKEFCWKRTHFLLKGCSWEKTIKD